MARSGFCLQRPTREEDLKMAQLDTDPLPQVEPPHDGMARCRRCATIDPGAGHDWCQATQGLVCESCCHHVLLGNLGRIMSGSFESDGSEQQLSVCAECERGQRWFASQVLDAVTPRHLPS
jgi:hypothetical protein